jgi:hypothetical protein
MTEIDGLPKEVKSPASRLESARAAFEEYGIELTQEQQEQLERLAVQASTPSMSEQLEVARSWERGKTLLYEGHYVKFLSVEADPPFSRTNPFVAIDNQGKIETVSLTLLKEIQPDPKKDNPAVSPKVGDWMGSDKNLRRFPHSSNLSSDEQQRLVDLQSIVDERQPNTDETPLIFLGKDYSEYRDLWERATGKKRTVIDPRQSFYE